MRHHRHHVRRRRRLPDNLFCPDAIKWTYGITVDLKPLDYDGALTRNALKQGRILIGEVFSADADLVKAGVTRR